MRNYTETLMWKEINETPRIFTEIMPKNQKTMSELVSAVKASGYRNIVGAGRGTSDHALIYFKYLTEIFSKYTVGLAGCSAVTMYAGKADFGGNVVLGVSQSGKAADVLEVLKRANAQGALTVAVTNDENSPMAKEAKFHLFCNCGEEKSVAATKTFSAQCFLLLWLAAELAENGELISKLPNVSGYAKDGFAAVNSATDKLVPTLVSMRDGFVLARGISYALALESTLKLQETCYILMKGYAESDFQHGPMAMVSEGTPILLYAPAVGFVSDELEQSHTDELIAIADKLGKAGGRIIAVTDKLDLGKTETYRVENSEGEVFAFFQFALFAQVLACKLSCARGNDPDAPRALKKVTITK